MMWQFTSKTRAISPAIMKALYADDSKPPGNAQVWIGAYTGEAGYSYPVSLSAKPKGAGLDTAVALCRDRRLSHAPRLDVEAA
jgi:hypothetical protein